MFHFSLQRRY